MGISRLKCCEYCGNCFNEFLAGCCVADFNGLSNYTGLRPEERRWAPRLHSSWHSVGYCNGIVANWYIFRPLCYLPFRPHRMHGVQRCGLIVTVVARSVCVSVCWTQPWVLQQRLNGSRCRLPCGLEWTDGTMYKVGARIPQWKG